MKKIKLSDITLGCDPEFEVRKDNKRICVLNILNNNERNHTMSSQIGTDCGSDYLLEIRPSPSNHPNIVINQVYKLLKQVVKRDKNIDVSVFSDDISMGGHIHIGFNGFLNANIKIPVKYTGCRCSMRLSRWTFLSSLKERLILLLDKTIGIKSRLIDNKHRIHGDCYGKLGDYSNTTYGIEYRTPSSVIFYNKKFATIWLKIAQRSVWWIINNTDKTIPNKITHKFYINELHIPRIEYIYFLNTILQLKKLSPQNRRNIVINTKSEVKNHV